MPPSTRPETLTRFLARAAAGALVFCRAAAAQLPPSPAVGGRAAAPSTHAWVAAGGSVRAVFAANVLLGGAVGGVTQKLRGGSFRDGLARGAFGGALAFAGKRVSIAEWDGAGLAGRQLAALGTGVIRNAAAGRPSLERVMLPLWPLHVYLRPDSAARVRVKLDVLTTVFTALSLAASGTTLEVRESLSSGVVVLREHDAYLAVPGEETCVPAYTFAGAVMVSDIMVPRTAGNSTVPHERVHVIQYDQFFTLVSDPAEQWLAPRVPGGRALKRYLDFNLLTPLLIVPAVLIDEAERRPWEQEAVALTRTTYPDASYGGAWWLCR